MIIQGSNVPITLLFDSPLIGAKKVEVTLTTGKRTLKHWCMEDLSVNGNIIICPLTEEETSQFPEGKVYIESKFLDSANITQFGQAVTDFVANRYDRKYLMENGDSHARR